MADERHSCDILVVGGGPAGLAAAYTAARHKQQVIVVDDNPTPGGQIWRGGPRHPPSPEAARWFERLRDVEINFINGARVFQDLEGNLLLAELGDRLVEFTYQRLIIATGAREQFVPFPGWTLPNVMGAGGLQALVKTGMPIAGKKIVIAGTGPLLMAVASYLKERGAEILLIAEQSSRTKLVRFGLQVLKDRDKRTELISMRKKLAGIPYLTSCWPIAANGSDKLSSVTLRRGQRTWDLACDYLACGFHLVPNLELAQLMRCEMESGYVKVDQFQETSREGVFSAGETTGIGGLALSLVEGEIAGHAVAEKHEQATKLFPNRDRQREFASVLNRTFALREELKSLATPETIVCRCEDVTFKRLEPYNSWREAKLQTRCGMGPCQGRICGPSVEFLFQWRVESVRPPLLPVRVESLRL